jgi:hypothetical protein
MALSIGDLNSKVSGWNFESKHVSEIVDNSILDKTVSNLNQFGSIHDIVDSGSTLICAGPASLAKATANGVRIVPIGLVDSAQISMNKPLNRIFEIGSKLSYIVPGKTVGGLSLNRVFFDGPSLLKMLYAGEVSEDSFLNGKKAVKFSSDMNGEITSVHSFDAIGSNNVAMNLFSGFFEAAFGLAFYFRNQNNGDMGAIYFEGCRIGSYGMGIQAQMSVLQEQVQIEFVNCVPINSLVTNTDSSTKSEANTDTPIIGQTT